ncbi:unnamed protein product [Rhizoctonia solani]|uniref:RING-type domain-containing protein n=1 Tax=Rhizoctonia solani TaxID=456999 RepID=A0A8H2WJ49_9AGAM|nr:unnamed protein product [Rhizoctonia solani]
MLAQHTEMELAKVNQVMHADSPDPTARGTGMSYEHNNRRPAAVRALNPPTPLRPDWEECVRFAKMTYQKGWKNMSIGVCKMPFYLIGTANANMWELHPRRTKLDLKSKNSLGSRTLLISEASRRTGYDIRDRNIPDVDEDLDVDGDEDTVLYGESQFFESDIIAGDEVGSDSRQMSPADTDEQSARLLRELVAARKMVMTQRDVDVEGEEEDERVSIGSSADTSMTWPPAPTGDGKDAQIEALLAQVKQLESALEQAKSQPAVLPKGRSSEGTNDAALTVCRICLDPFMEPVVSTGCWHLFCRECWLRSLGSTKYCPICKRITSTSNLRKVFM